MNGKAGRGADQFVIRFPDGMRDRIKAAADLRGQSMNTAIVAALEEAFPPPKPGPDDILLRLGRVSEAPGDAARLEEVATLNAMLQAAGEAWRVSILGDAVAIVPATEAD